jgi:tetratricopeptide (TPR) repeat protein
MLSVRSLICLFVLLFAFISAANTADAAKDEAERLWELGEKAYNAGRYHEALSYYEKSLPKCSGNLECDASNLNGIGAVYEALDDDRSAFKYYEDALAAARDKKRSSVATNTSWTISD